MTREEAIYCLQSYLVGDDGSGGHCTNCKYYGSISDEEYPNVLYCKSSEAIKIAIEALQQEPCEDAISRKEINAIIDEIIAENEAHEARIDWRENELRQRYETPERCERTNPNNPAKNTAMKYGYIADGAEEVKKKIGKLPAVTPIRPKGKWEYNSFNDMWRCNKCFISTENSYNYCPNCGVKMERE